MTLKSELGPDFLHLLTNFHCPMCNRSEVVALTNEQTNKSTNKQEILLKTSNSLRSAIRRWININIGIIRPPEILT